MPNVKLIIYLAVSGVLARGQTCGPNNGDYSVSYGDTTAFSVSKSDMVCHCPAGFETNGTVRAASFEGSGAALTNLTQQADVAALQSQVAALQAALAAANAKLAALTTNCTSGSAITSIDSDAHATCSPVGGGDACEDVFGGGLGSFCTSDAHCGPGLGCYAAGHRCLLCSTRPAQARFNVTRHCHA
eukprot:TRINITY_DN4484_c0_g1_i1.p1 TRINITY_DN4484_c0_g1~~TRINITY_DN4484_c0_g1_i1.p1  ORF type:complete len:214 (+),score=18.26 TRINITY_DN4484_c0_g1_i1:82-642(+)